MLVNDRHGDECRVAILRDGRLEDLFTERAATATSVGNIYKGRVSNVEPAIQAAFIDYGQAQRGFLHISDLHPRYFPSGDKTEKVGRKTSRRERPAMQEALKRGDEVIIQVLKEGIGTKGPTLTSYLSIPGRLMVMMPYMDKVGVTRRVEDEDDRREMRKVLDTLDLPDDFGFILRTAGMGQTKRELKRDVAYLTRLWKVMEKRITKTGVPAELYTESDLVLRTIRDVLRPEIKAIVVDSPSAYERAQAFLNVIAPRSAPPVVHYQRSMPLFHAFDVERQIETIHARKVDLPSGGALVIDQTEALVAIDVNSGRSRSARDSETNAYRTNLEAIEEISRQVRLRDLGGLIINDLIDMRQHSRRREVFQKFGDLLKDDRARTTILPISDFGILEMTRQRMRPSLRMAHYVECAGCSGHGEVKAPDAVAGDVIREIGYLLHCQETARIEVIVSPRVASSLLSTRRRALEQVEIHSGKPVDVRVSEATAVDRVTYYAYDAKGADLDLERLTSGPRPKIDDLVAEGDSDGADAPSTSTPRSGRRRRSRSSIPPADAAAIALSGEFQEELAQLEAESDLEEAADAAQAEKDEQPTRKRRRRRRRRRRPAPLITETSRLYVLAKALGITAKEIVTKFEQSGGESGLGFGLRNHMSSVTPEQASIIQGWFQPEPSDDEEPSEEPTTGDADEGGTEPRKRRRRGRRGRRGRGGGESAAGESTQDTKGASDEQGSESSSDDASSKTRTRRKRGSKRGAKKAKSMASTNDDTADASADADQDASSERRPARKKRSRRRRSSASNDTPADKSPASEPSDGAAKEEAPKPIRRGLYKSRRTLSPGAAKEAIAQGESD